MPEPLFTKRLDDLLPKTTSPRREVSGLDLPSSHLLALARYQKWQIWFIMLSIPLMLAVAGMFVFAVQQGDDEHPLLALAVVLYLLFAFVGIVLDALLGSKVFPIAGAVLGVILVVALGLIGLMIMNIIATSILKRNGIRVGLLGAKEADLARLRPIERT